MKSSRGSKILKILQISLPSNTGLNEDEKSTVIQNDSISDPNIIPGESNGFKSHESREENKSENNLNIAKYIELNENDKNYTTNISDDNMDDPDFVPEDEEYESDEFIPEKSQKSSHSLQEEKSEDHTNIAKYSDLNKNDENYITNVLDDGNNIGNSVSYKLEGIESQQNNSDCRRKKLENNLNITVKSNETQITHTKRKTKQDFCIFCKQLVTKIPRHFQTVHKNENEVKEFASYPKGHYYRKELIAKLRKEGNFIFNTDSSSNTDLNDILTCRRPQIIKNRDLSHYKPCPNCKGFYSKLTLRRHVRKCDKKNIGDRDILIRSRKIHGQIHKKACHILKNEVFPVLREDEISNAVKYDELAIVFANKLCTKYRSKHHHAMIRSKLRQIGRLIIEMRKLDAKITDYSSILEPTHFDNVIKAINIIARLNENTGKYGAPATAFSLGTLLKQSINILLFECIKQENKDKKMKAKEFLKLLQQDCAYSINRTVAENMLDAKRQKKIVLPTVSDIKLLNKYLDDSRLKYAINLKENGFSYLSWKNLVSFTFVSIQVFNRRRTGELERALIVDFENYESINEHTNKDLFESLNSEAQEATRRYVRFTIRGKLARGVPVLLHNELVENIKLILRFRENANVPKTNPYIFGLPGPNDHNYLRGNRYIRDYSIACGATNPQSLRGTELRKHIATQSVLLNLQEYEVHDLANFLGHDDKIHKDHYRMPILSRDIAQMSRLLELAQGDANESNEKDEETNNESDEENCQHIDKDDRSNDSEQNSVENKNEDLLPIDKSASTFDESVTVVHRTPEKQRKTATFVTPEKHNIVRKQRKHRNENAEIEESLRNENKNKETMTISHSTPEKQRIKEPSNTFIKRITWTTPEKKQARLLFAKNFRSHTLPSFNTCADYVSKYEVFKKRTPMQLKLWVHNNLQKMKKEQGTPKKQRKTGSSESSIKRTTWTTPEKKRARLLFAENLRTHILPSFNTCADYVSKYEEFKKRTPMQLKLWVHNNLQRMKKQLITE